MHLRTKWGTLLALVLLSPARASDENTSVILSTVLPPELTARYVIYIDAMKRDDGAAMSSLLTPDFTRTYEENTVSHVRALNDTHQLMKLMSKNSRYSHYQITSDKFFVKANKITVYVEERVSQNGPVTEHGGNRLTVDVTALSYSWIHHWMKTPGGWKIRNISRNFH